MRKEIETLARWYIPVYIVTLIISVVITQYVKETFPSRSFLSLNLLWLYSLIRYTDSLVIAIWLYFQSKRDSGRKWIWAFFGFVAHLFAVVLYLALKIYEKRNETFNKGIETDAE